MTGIGVVLAGLAALLSAVGDLLQRFTARERSSDPRHSWALMSALLRAPWWVLGVALSLVGLLVHVGALSIAALATVQPVLVAELPLAVVGSRLFFGSRLRRRDWSAVAALVAGIVVFLVFLAPGDGAPLAVDGATWTVGVATVLAFMALLTAVGRRRGQDVRAALLATAAGVGYGLTGVLLSVAGRSLGDAGLVGLVTAWQTWGAVLVGLTSFLLLQNAMAAGQLVAVEPGLTLANPVIAVTWGLVVFGETARAGPALVGSVLGGALIVGGVVVLARSPVLGHGPPGTTSGDPRADTAPGTGTGDGAATDTLRST